MSHLFAFFAVLLGFMLLGTIIAVLHRTLRRSHSIAVAVAALFNAEGNLVAAFHIRDNGFREGQFHRPAYRAHGSGRPAPYIAGGDLLFLINAFGPQMPGWALYTGYLLPAKNPSVWVDLTPTIPFDHISNKAVSLINWLTQFSADTSEEIIDAVRYSLLQVDLVEIETFLARNPLVDDYYVAVAKKDGTLSLVPCSDADMDNGCRHYGPRKGCTAGGFCPRPHIVRVEGRRVVGVGAVSLGVPLSKIRSKRGY